MHGSRTAAAQGGTKIGGNKNWRTGTQPNSQPRPYRKRPIARQLSSFILHYIAVYYIEAYHTMFNNSITISHHTTTIHIISCNHMFCTLYYAIANYTILQPCYSILQYTVVSTSRYRRQKYVKVYYGEIKYVVVYHSIL